jgi:hypothetical protein
MTKKNYNNVDFEEEFRNSLKSNGYLFPTKDAQVEYFLEHSNPMPLPEKYKTPDFIFKRNLIDINPLEKALKKEHNQDAEDWAIAARNGKKLPQYILDKMKADKNKSRE